MLVFFCWKTDYHLRRQKVMWFGFFYKRRTAKYTQECNRFSPDFLAWWQLTSHVLNCNLPYFLTLRISFAMCMFLRARTSHTLLSLGSPFHVAGVAGRCCCRSGSTYVTRLHNVEIYSKVPKFVPVSCLIFKNWWTWSLWVHYYSFLFY